MIRFYIPLLNGIVWLPLTVLQIAIGGQILSLEENVPKIRMLLLPIICSQLIAGSLVEDYDEAYSLEQFLSQRNQYFLATCKKIKRENPDMDRIQIQGDPKMANLSIAIVFFLGQIDGSHGNLLIRKGFPREEFETLRYFQDGGPFSLSDYQPTRLIKVREKYLAYLENPHKANLDELEQLFKEKHLAHVERRTEFAGYVLASLSEPARRALLQAVEETIIPKLKIEDPLDSSFRDRAETFMSREIAYLTKRSKHVDPSMEGHIQNQLTLLPQSIEHGKNYHTEVSEFIQSRRSK